jgi:hypothetical protein
MSMNSVKRFGAPVLMLIGVSLLILYEGLSFHYAKTRPHEPQPGVGRTIAFSNHGPPVFLTSSEDTQLLSIFDGGLACLLCAGILSVPWRKPK